MSTPAKANRDRLAFRDRLMRMRKSKDPYPWVAPLKKVWTPGATAPQEFRFQHQKPYDLLASELVHLNAFYGAAALDGISGGSILNTVAWDAQLLSGTDDREASSGLIAAEQLLGDSGIANSSYWLNELKRFVTGLRIPPMEIFRILARSYIHTSNAHATYPFGFEHALNVAFRGYQLYAKGSTPTPQLTYAEFADRGYSPQQYNPALTVNLVNSSAAEVQATYVVPQAGGIDFHATDFITVRSSSYLHQELRPMSQLLVKLEGFERPIMDDFIPLFMLGNVSQRWAWQFPQPLSVPQGTEIKLRIKARTPSIEWINQEPGRTPSVTVVLHGHNLIRR